MSNGTFSFAQSVPANETLTTVKAERLDINGAILGATGYGVHATLFCLCVNLLLKRLRRDPNATKFFLAYISLNFVLGSIYNGIICLFNQREFIDDRDSPGGLPLPGFIISASSPSLNIFSSTAAIISTWTQDGLLLYRFCVIFNYNKWMVPFPFVAYLGTIGESRSILAFLPNGDDIVFSCLYLATLSPAANAFSANLVNFAFAHWSISIGTTIILTLCIVGRLLIMRYRIEGIARGSPYLSVSAMLIESAFLYSVAGLIGLVCFAKKFPTLNLVLPLLGQLQSIAPLLIILRVAQGQALERDTFKTTGEISSLIINTTLSSTSTKSHTDSVMEERRMQGAEVQIDTVLGLDYTSRGTPENAV